MLQSCETLITKINEWQKAILELEKLSSEFLNTSDESLKVEIKNQKEKIEKQSNEYLDLMHQKLPDGQNLFWPEKELYDEFMKGTGIDELLFLIPTHPKIIKDIKNGHIICLDFGGILGRRTPRFDLSRFRNLEMFLAYACGFTELPKFPRSIKTIYVSNSPDIQFSDDLSELENLEALLMSNCESRILPKLSKSIKEIVADGNLFSRQEKNRIRKEYPNAKIIF